MVALSMPTPEPSDVLHVIMGREPDDDERKMFRLRMEWDAKSQNVGSLEPGELVKRLDRAHDHVQTCFRACFTDTGWQLFEPG